jgi:hypothetical protein
MTIAATPKARAATVLAITRFRVAEGVELSIEDPPHVNCEKTSPGMDCCQSFAWPKRKKITTH